MPKYELFYFKSRGRAELVRLCLAYADQEFEDTRLDKEQWQAGLKDKLVLPFMPALKVDDGTYLQETCLIAQYVGNQHGFGGSSEAEKHQVCSMTFFIESILTKLVTQFFEEDEEKKAQLMKTFKETFMPMALKKMTNQIKQSGKGVFFGEDITVADIHFYNVFFVILKEVPNLLEPFAELSALYKKVESHPRIVAWVEKRPVTEY